MKAYIVKKYVLVHDWAPHPVYDYENSYRDSYPSDGVR
jgi:hypothetical protein